MNRRTLLAGLAALPLLTPALPASAGELSIAQINQYLNQFRTASGSFVQKNPGGSLSQGNFWMQRPGKIRFEYAGGGNKVLADGINVAVFDGKSNRGPQRYPLSQTPLNILLSTNTNLTSPGVVKQAFFDGTATHVVAQDPRFPERGTIEMVFTDPAELRQWVVTDGKGQKTTVILNELNAGVAIEPVKFNIELEERR
ncbi:LolA family protein [Paracoccaceae bacterium GXU_MW_L88]